MRVVATCNLLLQVKPQQVTFPERREHISLFGVQLGADYGYLPSNSSVKIKNKIQIEKKILSHTYSLIEKRYLCVNGQV